MIDGLAQFNPESCIGIVTVMDESITVSILSAVDLGIATTADEKPFDDI